MDEVLIARIVARVLALLNGHQNGQPPAQPVLMLFSGASTGQQAGLEALQMLAGAGHDVTVGISFAAGNLLAQERLHQAGASRVIGPGTWVDAPALVRQSQLVLVPTLSMNFAGRLALGLLDDLLATLVMGALLAGKPVVAVRDGADPDGAGGQVFGGGRAAPALRKRLSGNLQTLASYGLELVPQEEFLAAVRRHLGSQAVAPAPAQPALTHAIITQADLAGLDRNGLLHVPAGSRLTPLARDAAVSLGLQIIYD